MDTIVLTILDALAVVTTGGLVVVGVLIALSRLDARRARK